MLLKYAIVQLGKTKGTDKMLRVEPVPHSTDTAPSNGLPTAVAYCPLTMVVVKLTVGAAI